MGKMNLVVPTGLNGGMTYEVFEQMMDRALGRTPTQKPAATTQKPTQPARAAAPSKPAPKPFVPPTRATLWQDILRHAGSDDPKAIAAFMETELGGKIYGQWLLAE